MAAGAEYKAGVQTQGQPAALGNFLPFRNYHQLFANRYRLIVFPPVVFPIAVLHKACLNVAVGIFDLPQHGLALFVIGEIALYAADPFEFVLQLLIHIIPVLVVALQKTPEILLIFYHKASSPHVRHLLAAQVYLLRRGIYGNLYVTHGLSPLSCITEFISRFYPICSGLSSALNSGEIYSIIPI